MVEIGSGPVKESIDNTVFIVPGIIIGFLVLYTFRMGGPTYNVPEVMGDSYFEQFLTFLLIAIPGVLIVFFTYKLIKSLRDKERVKEEKKKLKQQRREKESQKKIKKK